MSNFCIAENILFARKAICVDVICLRVMEEGFIFFTKDMKMDPSHFHKRET